MNAEEALGLISDYDQQRSKLREELLPLLKASLEPANNGRTTDRARELFVEILALDDKIEELQLGLTGEYLRKRGL